MRCAARDERDAKTFQVIVTGNLHGQIASEPDRRLAP
jgi:hypothetical protein